MFISLYLFCSAVLLGGFTLFAFEVFRLVMEPESTKSIEEAISDKKT
jgi:hypothetical protein